MKPRKTTEENEGDPPEPGDATAQDIQQAAAADKDAEAAMAIEAILDSEEMVDGTCRVKRRGQTEQDYLFLERVPVSSMKPDLFDYIAKRYGGGRYELWFFLPRGGYYAKKNLIVDYRVTEGEFFKSQRQPAEAPTGNGETSAIAKLVDKIAGTGDGQNQNLILTFLKMSQDQNAAMLAANAQMVGQMMTAMSAMFAAVKSTETKPQFNMLEAMAVFDKLKAKENPIDPLRMFEVMHKWFRDNQGDGDDQEPWWLKPIQALAPVLLGKMPQQQIADAQAQSQPQPQPQPVMQPIAGPVDQPLAQPAPLNPPGTEPDPNDPMNIIFLIRMIRPKIFAQIKNGATPQDAVDLVENPLLLTDAQYEKLEEVLRKDDWLKELFGNVADLTPEQIAWLTEFRRLILTEEKA